MGQQVFRGRERLGRGRAGGKKRGYDSDPRQGVFQGCAAHHAEHAFEVVSHNRQAHFAERSVQSAQKKTRMAKDNVFENGERMLHRASS